MLLLNPDTKLTKRDIDPSIIENASVTALEIVDAVNEVGIKWRLHFQPTRKSLLLQETDNPENGCPGCVVRGLCVDF